MYAFMSLYTSDTLELSDSASESDEMSEIQSECNNEEEESQKEEEESHKEEEESHKAEEQSHKEEEESDRQEEHIKAAEDKDFIRWISLILLRLKLSYNLSNSIFLIFLNLIYFIFWVIRHPLHLLFPKTINNLETIANLKVLNKTIIFAVCPNPKCSSLCQMNNISFERNGVLRPALCRNKIYGKRCNTELSFERKLSFGKTKMVAYKTYPFLPPSEWIKTFFTQEEFLQLIRKRPEPSTTEYRDIWDGRILQAFLMDPADSTKPLLKNKMNLALLLYLDFFNPFQRAVYSCGAIYMSVLNIPKSQRFKAKWSMLIGLIPGPSEPEGHINTYLTPVVNDLIQLYNGIQIRMLSSEIIFSRSLLLPVLADIPASRKLSQYKSHKADLPCDKCMFTAIREKGTRGASGKMSFYTSQKSPVRTDGEVRRAMHMYRKATSKASAQAISQKTGVKYSELSRLPYFNMVDSFVIDPMHSILMGLVSDLGEELITNSSELMTDKERVILANRLNAVRVPYDLGRLPKTMLDKMSARGLKAQQWKNFIITYARVCLWNIIPYRFYDAAKCLAEAVELLLKDPITRSEVDAISCLLKKHHGLYANVFGKFEVSVNYHMALHIPELIQNWGPPTSWWCFPYERHIGLLGDVNTSGKTVEEEIFQNFVMQHLIDSAELPSLKKVRENEIPLSLKPFLNQHHGDDRHLAEGTEEWVVYQRIQAERLFRGIENIYMMAPSTSPESDLEIQLKVEREDLEEIDQKWTVKMLPPLRIKQRPKLEFYNKLKKYMSDIHEDSFLFVEPRIDTFARCVVNGSTFSSAYNRTDRGQTALIYCVDKLDKTESKKEVSPYFVQVRFFFTARVHLKDSNGATMLRVHHLASVDWFYFANKNHEADKLSGLPALKNSFYRGENIVNVRRLIRRVALLPVKKNYLLVANLSR